jgi:glycosyltransferase involved in cell wall biosynthesis
VAAAPERPLAGRVVSVDARYLKRPGIGISVYVDGAIRALREDGGAVVLVTDDGGHARELAGRYRLESVALVARGGFAWEQLALPRFLRDRRPDVHLAGANYGLPLRCPQGTRRALVVHDLIPLRMPGAYLVRRPAWAAKYLLSLGVSLAVADLVVANSRATAADVRRLRPRRPLRVLYPRLATPAGASPRGAAGGGGPYLLYNGGLDRRKMVPVLLDAFAAVRRERPDLRLVLLGAGYDALDGALARLGLDAAAVERPGYVSEDDKAAYLRAARAVVYPSLLEGFGLPIVEALAAGTPVVCGTGGAQPEIAGPAALYADPRLPTSVAAAITEVLDDGVRARLVAAGRRRVAELAAEPGPECLGAALAETCDTSHSRHHATEAFGRSC